jgi:BCD family chlorophyll transporter-like MFS transporter
MVLGLLHLFNPTRLNPMRRWLDAHPSTSRWLAVLRLGLLQFGLGLSIAPVTGTLNRVLIDEMQIPAVLVGFLISLHYFVSPVRAMLGYQSDKARAMGKWRTPYIVLGVMLTYGGLACAPFALILLSGEGVLPFGAAVLICTLIFLAYGAGVNIVETIFLALVSDLTPPKDRGKVLAVLWMMLILGTIVSALFLSNLLVDYSHRRLIEVMQGCAILFVVLTTLALFNQEKLKRDGSIDSELEVVRVRLTLWESFRLLNGQRTLQGLFAVIFLATMAFTTHDVLLEPYGGQVLGMSVAATLRLTVIWGVAMMAGVAAAAGLLWGKRTPMWVMGAGCVVGLTGFGIISYAGSAQLLDSFRLGVGFISMGRGLFLVGSVILVMSLTDISHAGFLLGVWGIVQAMAQGIGTIGGGLLRDLAYAATGNVVVGYVLVYGSALALLLGAVLVLWGWLRRRLRVSAIRLPWSGLEEIPADQLAF